MYNYCVLKNLFYYKLQVLATTTVRRLAVLDVETGEQIFSYDNCKILLLTCKLYPVN